MSKIKIMIVDDDRQFLEELREVLALNGFDVVSCADPARVTELAGAAKPALIVLDLKMSTVSGFELADELRRFTKTFDIPVIAMTGFFTEREHLALLSICGVRTCLTKPFAPQEMIQAIETELTARSPA